MIRCRIPAALTLALMAGTPGLAEEGGLTRSVLAMGTTLTVTAEGLGGRDLAGATEAALAEVARLEAALSTWRKDSAFSRLNAAEGRPVALEPEWLALLDQAARQSRRTGGAFDPLLMPLLRAWGVRDGGRRPTTLALRDAREATGLRYLLLDEKAGTARLTHPRAGVEEGGFAKGYALDRAAAELRRGGASAGLLDFGGQLLAFGIAREVGVACPGDRQRAQFSLRLQDASLSMSGTSERGRHLLDPRTGRPAPAWGTVAVVAPTAFEADCLSTALFILGPRAGSTWAARHGVAACFLSHDGRVRMTPAFAALNPQPSPELP